MSYRPTFVTPTRPSLARHISAVFSTHEEALEYGADTLKRWAKWREAPEGAQHGVAFSEDPANYRYEKGRLVALASSA